MAALVNEQPRLCQRRDFPGRTLLVLPAPVNLNPHHAPFLIVSIHDSNTAASTTRAGVQVGGTWCAWGARDGSDDDDAGKL
jgi:hypothetical protein